MSEAIYRIYDPLDRLGPGDPESLGWALEAAGTPRDGRVLDAGAGTGADVAALRARVPAGYVTAIEMHRPWAARIAAAHVDDPRIFAVAGDMARPEGRFDLIWSAGAVYNLGVTEALGGWRRHLAPGGCVAFTEIGWRVPAPSAAARALFAAEYAEMTDRAGILARVEAAGYRVIAERWLDEAAWSAYYDPLARRCADLRAQAEGDADLAEALDALEAEIAVWRAHGGDFGYLLIVAEPADGR